MDHPSSPQAEDLAEALVTCLAHRGQIPPLTGAPGGLDLSQAYQVTAAVRRLRETRGERVVGRKIGFTNRTIWHEYGVHAPIWGYVYDSTLHWLEDLGGAFDISGVVEPRIEPEIALGLSRSPEPGMDDRALLGCVAWISHGFEIVQSLFPDWRFQAADTVAAFGLHGALLLGPLVKVEANDLDRWAEELSDFGVTMLCDGAEAARGRAGNVLGGGPLAALRHLVDVLAVDARSPQLSAGEVVTTGTLTKALPIAPGQTWSTELEGTTLEGATVSFVS